MDHVEGPLHVLLVEKERQPYLICYISSFSFFLLSFVFYIDEGGKKSAMDHLERRGGVLVVLALYWYLHILCNLCLTCKHWHSMEDGGMH